MQKLLKAQAILTPFRKTKVKEETLQRRKELKKEKMMNIYSGVLL